jgi:Fe-S cluster assembly protein SufB
MEWVDGNLGSKLTMKYPAVWLMEPGARGDVLSIAFAGNAQHQDAGAKMVHKAPYTTSNVVSKSISKGTGRATYRGLLEVAEDAHHVKANVRCDALLIGEDARSDTYPTINVANNSATIQHEATVSKVGEDQLFYLMSRGISENDATSMVINGFIEPITKEIPLEYAVELNRLIELQMEGSIG